MSGMLSKVKERGKSKSLEEFVVEMLNSSNNNLIARLMSTVKPVLQEVSLLAGLVGGINGSFKY